MKTFRNKRIGFYSLVICALLTVQTVQAQENGHFLTVSGVIKSKANKKNLDYVTISVPGSSVSTVTNAEGEFSIKIGDSISATHIEFSSIGYHNLRVPIYGSDIKDGIYLMEPKSQNLKEVTIVGWEAKLLVQEAIQKIPINYSNEPKLLTGFYRETSQKGKKYINIAEAIIAIYKTPYEENTDRDRVEVLKGRKLLSPKLSDTLVVKLLGGPNLSVFVDIVKNPDILLSQENLDYFKFTHGEFTSIDDRVHYVINFEPHVALSYPLYYGKLYIDKTNLSFTRAEFFLDMEDRTKATEVILRKKPSGLHFKPEEVSFIVTYKQRGDKSYLSYIRNEVRFKCDWKKRLFATTYSVVSEMVVTDDQTKDIATISGKNAFKIEHSLSDRVVDFYDDSFWGHYNIIEPTESLESAVNKLKKGYK